MIYFQVLKSALAFGALENDYIKMPVGYSPLPAGILFFGLFDLATGQMTAKFLKEAFLLLF